MPIFSQFGRQRGKSHPFRQATFSQPEKAQLTGALFDNPQAQRARNLYWSAYFFFPPIDYLDEEWRTSVSINWLTFEPDQKHWCANEKSHRHAECTWYLSEHVTAKSWTLETEHMDNDMIAIRYLVVVDAPGLAGDPCPDLFIKGKTIAGPPDIYITRENLFPKPTGIDDARNMIEPFFPKIRDYFAVIEEDDDGFPISNPRNYIFRMRQESF